MSIPASTPASICSVSVAHYSRSAMAPIPTVLTFDRNRTTQISTAPNSWMSPMFAVTADPELHRWFTTFGAVTSQCDIAAAMGLLSGALWRDRVIFGSRFSCRSLTLRIKARHAGIPTPVRPSRTILEPGHG